MLHQFGSQLYTVPGLSGVAVPAFAGGTPGTVGASTAPGQRGIGAFQFATNDFVTGLILVPKGNVLGVRQEMAKLAVGVTDMTGKQLVGDGRGITIGRVLPNGAPAMALVGGGVRPFALQAPVKSSDIWTVQIWNWHAAILTLCGVYFLVEDRKAGSR